MNLAQALKNEILTVTLSSDHKGLFVVGKIAKDTSVELMKVLKLIEDDPKSGDLFFAFHHNFDKPGPFLDEIFSDMCEQYSLESAEIDPDGKLGRVFSRPHPSLSQVPTEGFIHFLRDLSSALVGQCDNLVFLLDPEIITDVPKFDRLVCEILDAGVNNVKLIVYEDVKNAEQTKLLSRRFDVRNFRLPSTTEEIIDYMENALTYDITLSEVERAQLQGALGEIYGSQGKIEKALSRYDPAVEWYTQNGKANEETLVLMKIALMYYMNKKFDDSVSRYLVASNRSRINKMYPSAIFCTTQIARIYIQQEKKTQALESLKSGLVICEESHDEASKANILSEIGSLEIELKKKDQGIESLEEALALDKKSQNFFGEARDLDKLSKVYEKDDKLRKAREYGELSRKIQKDKGFSLEPDKSGKTRSSN